jgi:hypothetical protein
MRALYGAAIVAVLKNSEVVPISPLGLQKGGRRHPGKRPKLARKMRLVAESGLGRQIDPRCGADALEEASHAQEAQVCLRAESHRALELIGEGAMAVSALPYDDGDARGGSESIECQRHCRVDTLNPWHPLRDRAFENVDPLCGVDRRQQAIAQGIDGGRLPQLGQRSMSPSEIPGHHTE